MPFYERFSQDERFSKDPYYVLEAFLAFRWVFMDDHTHKENIFWRSGTERINNNLWMTLFHKDTVQSVQYRVYGIQGASQFVQSIINFLAESPHQDGKACLEGQHVGPPFPASKHPQVEGDLEVECSRTCRMS